MVSVISSEKFFTDIFSLLLGYRFPLVLVCQLCMHVTVFEIVSQSLEVLEIAQSPPLGGSWLGQAAAAVTSVPQMRGQFSSHLVTLSSPTWPQLEAEWYRGDT